MKTEQLAEKAKEYSFNMYDKNLDVITQIESAFKNGYKEGYQAGLDEFALAEIQAFQKGLAQKDAEWQEKLRWIPLREGTYPDVRDKFYRILVNNEDGILSVEGIHPDYTDHNFENLSRFCTHWREIIE